MAMARASFGCELFVEMYCATNRIKWQGHHDSVDCAPGCASEDGNDEMKETGTGARKETRRGREL
jgi:hypothetical protein